MRIAIDCRMLLERPTGIGRHISQLVANLISIDKNNKYLLLVNNDILLHLHDGVNVVVKKINATPMSLSEQLVIPIILNKEKIDIYHSPSFVVPLFVPCKSIITIHDLIHLKYPAGFGRLVQLYYRLILKPAVYRAKYVIAVSESSRKDICGWGSVGNDKVITLWNGIERKYKRTSDETLMTGIRKKYGINKPYIFYNGNKRAHKNVASLVKAFEVILNRCNIDCNLVITGKIDNKVTENDCSQIDMLAESLDVSDSIIYTGSVTDDDLILLYTAADVFVFPSFYEGFGFPPLEAMACGCPVVVSKASSLPEVCGDAAYYIDPYDVESIAEGICAVMTNKKLRNEMVEKGLLRARIFTWENCARKTLEIYERTCEQ